jgi:hypothetical protein
MKIFAIFVFWSMVFSTVASANFRNFDEFGLAPVSRGSLQVEGWPQQVPLTGPAAETQIAYSRPAPEGQGEDRMTIFSYITRHEKMPGEKMNLVEPKTAVITPAFSAPQESDKKKREIFIYGFDKTMGINSVSYCAPGLSPCATVTKASCELKKPAIGPEVETNSKLLTNHFTNHGLKFTADLAKAFRKPDTALAKEICEKVKWREAQ